MKCWGLNELQQMEFKLKGKMPPNIPWKMSSWCLQQESSVQHLWIMHELQTDMLWLIGEPFLLLYICILGLLGEGKSLPVHYTKQLEFAYRTCSRQSNLSIKNTYANQQVDFKSPEVYKIWMEKIRIFAACCHSVQLASNLTFCFKEN